MSGTVELHGIELLTRDVERLVGFYQKVLHAGREDSHGGPDRVELLLPNGGKGANLTITRNPQAPDDGQRAICMEIWVDDVDREYEWLLENQITVSRPPASLPWGFRYLELYDPDGNHISLVSKLGEK